MSQYKITIHKWVDNKIRVEERVVNSQKEADVFLRDTPHISHRIDSNSIIFFNREVSMDKKIIKVNTVQGIGDLMWVYRKLAPLVDGIKFNILLTNNDTTQRRSGDFLATLDKCAGVEFTMVPGHKYDQLAKSKCVIQNSDAFDYAVNAWLEDGIHLDDIDTNPVLWDMNLKSEETENLPEKYLLVYVSGSERHANRIKQMADGDWVRLIGETAIEKNLNNIIFIGAEYDRWKVESVINAMKTLPFNCIPMFADIKKSTHIIKNADYFVAYQSGLCMIAEEFGVQTAMVWFPDLVKMRDTWIRKENIDKKLFTHLYFNQTIESMISQIKDNNV